MTNLIFTINFKKKSNGHERKCVFAVSTRCVGVCFTTAGVCFSVVEIGNVGTFLCSQTEYHVPTSQNMCLRIHIQTGRRDKKL